MKQYDFKSNFANLVTYLEILAYFRNFATF